MNGAMHRTGHGGGQIALVAALLALLAAGVVAGWGVFEAPGSPATANAKVAPEPPPAVHPGEALADLQRRPVSDPAHTTPQLAAGTFLVRLQGVAPELLPYLRVQCSSADTTQQVLAVLQPDGDGALRIAAPAPAQHLAVRTARGERLLREVATGERRVVPLAGGEVSLAIQPSLAGVQLVDRDGERKPFALGIEQPATDLELRALQLVDADETAGRFYVSLGAGPQLRIGRESLRTEGPIWTLDLRGATEIAQLIVRPAGGMQAAPRQLHMAAFAADEQHWAVRTADGWLLALEPGDYDLFWLPSGPRLPLAAGVHLEAGESRCLEVQLPATRLWLGSIDNWEDLPARQRPRMVRIGEIRGNVDATGSFELLLAEPMPRAIAVELSRFTSGTFTMAGRPARMLARDDAAATLLVEDTFAEQLRLRARCESQHDGVVGIQVYGLLPQPHCRGVITAGDEILLPDGDEVLLLIAIEKVGGHSWPLVMQSVPCRPGEVILHPATRDVPVTGAEGWWITVSPPPPFDSCEVTTDVLPEGTMRVPLECGGIHARRGSEVHHYPADVDRIDLP